MAHNTVITQKQIYEEMKQRVRDLEEELAKQKRVTERLRSESDKLNALLDGLAQTKIGVDIVSIDYEVLYQNKTLIDRFGDIVGKKCYREYMNLEEPCSYCPMVLALKNKRLEKIELRSPDGKDYEILSAPLRNPDNTVDKVIEVVIDITERKRTLTQLKESEEKFRTIFESATDGIVVVDLETKKLLMCNTMFCKMFGYSPDEISKLKFTDIHPKEDFPYILEKLEELSREEIYIANEILLKRKNGSIFYVDINTSPIIFYGKQYTMGIIRDITETKHLEAQLQQAQKMESIGTLAGGIAHDFNNLLSAIVGYTELSKMKLPENSDIIDDLAEILKASERARKLVKQILTFSRHEESKLAPILIDFIVKEALKLIRSSIPATIEIKKNIEKCGTIMADATQIHQIIMNLCTNAYHAMEDKGGIMEVTLNEVNISSADAALYHDLKPGPYVRLCCSDTGYGIDQSVMERIFEPYFTTKKSGKGTGLGLAVVHGIVKNHKGAIKVYSEPSKGSTFLVYLPLIKKEITEVKKFDEKLSEGKETILFIDDEQSIANLGKRILEKLGYSVESKTNCIEALDLFRSNPEKFDIVITDMTMPDMTGDVLANKLMAIRPDIPVIICTGFSEQISEQKALKKGIKSFLMKPLSSIQLAKAVREVLDGEITDT